FGGSFWGGSYSNIRLANIILHGVDKVNDFTDQQRQGIRGFAHTIQALELLTVITTHAETGAVIDTDHPLGEPLGPFVKKDAVYAEIVRLLDQAKDELGGPGTSFSFALSPGYTGFNTPANYLKVNRAIRARVAAYIKDYPTVLSALKESFLNDTMMISFTQGVSHVYSTSAGDATNGLINVAIYAHPSLLADAQKQADGTTLDARYVNKVTNYTTKMGDPPKDVVTTVTSGADSALKTNLKFKIYTNVAPVPVIRNEELILLKAEARWFTGDHDGATTELNIVRTGSGKLPALAATPADDNAFIDALLYERRYS